MFSADCSVVLAIALILLFLGIALESSRAYFLWLVLDGHVSPRLLSIFCERRSSVDGERATRDGKLYMVRCSRHGSFFSYKFEDIDLAPGFLGKDSF